MAAFDLFLAMLDDLDSFTPMILLAAPMIAAMVLRFVSMVRSMRLEGDAINVALLLPPGFVYLIALFWHGFLPVVAFGGGDPAAVLGGLEAAQLAGAARELLLLSPALAAVCVLYSLFSRRYNERAAGRPLPLLLLLQNPVEWVLCAAGLGLSLLLLVGALALDGGTLRVLCYLLGAVLTQMVLVGLALLWMLLFTNRRGELVGRGANPVERLRYKIRRRQLRSSLIWLMLVVFLSAMILPALLMEFGVGREITGRDAPLGKWRNDNVSMRPDSLRLAVREFSSGNSLLCAAVGQGEDELVLYVMVAREEADGLLADPHRRLRGQLTGVNGETLAGMLRQDEGAVPDADAVPTVYLNLTRPPDYGVLYFLGGLFGVMLLVGLKFYLPAINPGLSAQLRALPRLYPGFAEMMAEVGAEESDASRVYYRDDFHLVTASYLVIERFDTIRVTAFRQIAALHPQGELQFQLKLHSGGVLALACPNAQAREAVCKALKTHWNLQPTPADQRPPVAPAFGGPPAGGQPAYPGHPQGGPPTQGAPPRPPAHPAPPPYAQGAPGQPGNPYPQGTPPTGAPQPHNPPVPPHWQGNHPQGGYAQPPASQPGAAPPHDRR